MALLLVSAIGVDALGPDPVADPEARLAPSYLVKASVEELGELLVALLALNARLLALSEDRQGTTMPAPRTRATDGASDAGAATTATATK